MWMLGVARLICCGGAALLLAASGVGLAGAGVISASFWLLVGGFVVVEVGVAWAGLKRSGPRSPSG